MPDLGIRGDLIPDRDVNRNVGSPTKRLNKIYAREIIADTLSGTSGSGGGGTSYSLTVLKTGGTPTVPDVNVIEFDGAVVTNPSLGAVKVDIATYVSGLGYLKSTDNATISGTWNFTSPVTGTSAISNNQFATLSQVVSEFTLGWFLRSTDADTTGSSRGPIYRVDRDLTILDTYLHAKTAPVGSSYVINVLYSTNLSTWNTIYSIKPSIASTVNLGVGGTLSVTQLSKGNYLRLDVDQVGSSTTGDEITVTLEMVRRR